MTTRIQEPVHTPYIPDKADIISGMNSRNPLETLREMNLYNWKNPDTCIKLDASEDNIFINHCIKALNELEKKSPDEALELAQAFKLMLDVAGRIIFDICSDITVVLDTKESEKV